MVIIRTPLLITPMRLKLSPCSRRLMLTRAAAYVILKDYNPAIADCDKALSQDQNLPLAYINRASADNGLANYDQAIQDCNKAIALDYDLPQAYITGQMPIIMKVIWAILSRIAMRLWKLIRRCRMVITTARWPIRLLGKTTRQSPILNSLLP